MDPAALATTLMSMSAMQTQTLANYAVMKKQFQMEKSVIDLVAPTSKPPAPTGTGLLVDKTA
jgi:hypothetical protein